MTSWDIKSKSNSTLLQLCHCSVDAYPPTHILSSHWPGNVALSPDAEPGQWGNAAHGRGTRPGSQKRRVRICLPACMLPLPQVLGQGGGDVGCNGSSCSLHRPCCTCPRMQQLPTDLVWGSAGGLVAERNGGGRLVGSISASFHAGTCLFSPLMQTR